MRGKTEFIFESASRISFNNEVDNTSKAAKKGVSMPHAAKQKVKLMSLNSKERLWWFFAPQRRYSCLAAPFGAG